MAITGRDLHKVAAIKTSPEHVIEDVKRAMRMAEYDKFLEKGKTVILKDNISWHFPFPGANTTPWQLEGVIQALKEDGYDDIVCVQNKTVVTNPYKGERLNKYSGVFQKYNIPVLFNFKDEDMKWVVYRPKARMLVLDKIFPEGILIPDYFFDKNIIHLPTIKCHIYATTTGAMKNAFGGLLNTKRYYTHSVIHDTLVDLLNIQYEIHAGVFTVMDGTTTGNGPGPRTMIPVRQDYLLASGDSVAIDAAAAHMMGFDPMELDYIRHAVDQGLGCGEFERIEVIGEDISGENWGYSVGNNAASLAGNLLWFGPLKFLQKLMFHTPLVNVFILGSAFYHDCVHWPIKGKKVYNNWLKESPWGQLFGEYE